MSETKLKYCFGIDFGTTNCATVGYVYRNSYEKILYGDDEQRPIPSVVAINKATAAYIQGEMHGSADRSCLRNVSIFHQ